MVAQRVIPHFSLDIFIQSISLNPTDSAVFQRVRIIPFLNGTLFEDGHYFFGIDGMLRCQVKIPSRQFRIFRRIESYRGISAGIPQHHHRSVERNDFGVHFNADRSVNFIEQFKIKAGAVRVRLIRPFLRHNIDCRWTFAALSWTQRKNGQNCKEGEEHLAHEFFSCDIFGSNRNRLLVGDIPVAILCAL